MSDLEKEGFSSTFFYRNEKTVSENSIKICIQLHRNYEVYFLIHVEPHASF